MNYKFWYEHSKVAFKSLLEAYEKLLEENRKLKEELEEFDGRSGDTKKPE